MTSRGFSAAAAGLQAVSQQTRLIRQQAAAGGFALQPEALLAAAEHCENESRELRDLVRDVDRMTRLSGLGDYPSGRALTQRFVDKATDPEAGAAALIRLLQKELQAQAEAFRAAAREYHATDEWAADEIQRGSRQ